MRFLIALLFLCLALPAHALTVSSAKIDKAAVLVKGKGAAPFATIAWEGQTVGQASKSGAFKFAATVVPSDCVGAVSDGTTTALAAVKFCGPPGPPGLSTPRLVVKDASDTVVGSLFTEELVVVAAPDGPAAVHFHGDRFPQGVSFDYESGDCSGQALRNVSGPRVLRESFGVLDGVAYLTAVDGAELERHSTETRPTSAEDCANRAGAIWAPPDRCCCPVPACQGSFTTKMAPPSTVDVSGFVPPFHVELR